MRTMQRLSCLFLIPSISFALISCADKKREEPGPGINLSGTIQLDQKLSGKTGKSDVIFLIAKKIEGGPPLAVKRFSGNDYPYSFHLTQEDVMVHQEKLEEPLNLTVRVDKDGDAMTKKPGDLAGSYEKNPVSLRSDDITITVNEIVK